MRSIARSMRVLLLGNLVFDEQSLDSSYAILIRWLALRRHYKQ